MKKPVFQMTSDFVLKRLDVIAGSAHERESGNETVSRMFSYLESHKEGNELAMKFALTVWLSSDSAFKQEVAKCLLDNLRLRHAPSMIDHTPNSLPNPARPT